MNASLTSPRPIPPGLRTSATNRKPPAMNAAIRFSSSAAGVGQRDDRRCDDHPWIGDLVRDDLVLEVDQRDRHEQQHQDEPEERVGVGPLGDDDERAQEACAGLHERIAPRDRRLAVAAAPAQQQPREHRDVVVGLDRRPARRAARAAGATATPCAAAGTRPRSETSR